MLLDKENLKNVVRFFLPKVSLPDVSPIGEGHINATFLVSAHGTNTEKFVLQRINTDVFSNYEFIAHNIGIICPTLKLSNLFSDTLEVVQTSDGKPFYLDSSKSVWRMFRYIENTESFSVCPSRDYAFEAGRGLACFHKALSGLDPATIKIVIRDFHNTEVRLAQYEVALKKATQERKNEARNSINSANEMKNHARTLEDALRRGELKLRVCHMDPKLNNFLFDIGRPSVRAMVDFDTCMPGTWCYDLGDLVRSVANRAKEDEEDLALVKVDQEFCAAVFDGYFGVIGNLISPHERKYFAEAPAIISYELGLRFLTDFLQGDKYFPVKTPKHNLIRARNQFALATQF